MQSKHSRIKKYFESDFGKFVMTGVFKCHETMLKKKPVRNASILSNIGNYVPQTKFGNILFLLCFLLL